jgi:hypothetical protein
VRRTWTSARGATERLLRLDSVGVIANRLRSLRRSFRRRTVLRLANPYGGTGGIEPVVVFARTLEDATAGTARRRRRF